MNDVPLGNRRRWGGGGGDSYSGGDSDDRGYGSRGYGGRGGGDRDGRSFGGFGGDRGDRGFGGRGGGYGGRGRDSYDGPKRRAIEMPQSRDDGPRKRRSRWGGTAARGDTAPAAISANVSGQELDRYAVQVRLEEINRKIRTGDVEPPNHERSPSPPPTYDVYGRRNNTREQRYRQKLEDERVLLIERQMRLDPYYRPPTEYHTAKRSTRPMDKVYLPMREFPEINFFGLLVGPRGNTLKRMERDSGAKIHIRGRGSVKHGRMMRPDEEEEDMHCIVTAETEKEVKHCIRLINEVVATAASTPEAQNDHKRNQLRELAVLNGTLRDDENQVCPACGEKGHRRFDCPHDMSIVCRRCGGMGHLARDCGDWGSIELAFGGSQMDTEYMSFLSELGENPSQMYTGYGLPTAPLRNEKGEKIPPWRDPLVWSTSAHTTDFLAISQHNGAAKSESKPEEKQDYSAEWAAYYAAQAAQQAQGDGTQKDYSKEWEEYYRQQALLAQGQAPAAGQQHDPAEQPASAPSEPAPTEPAPVQ